MLAVGLGQKLNMSSSSVRRYLLGGEFERIGKGQYRKVIKEVAGEH
jgi:hypothetical protein